MNSLQWPADFDPAAKRAWWRKYPGDSRRIFEQVSKQLLDRERPAPEIWGEESARIQTALRICRRIQEQYEWPNDRFLPGDPVDIVMLMPWDDLDIVEFVMQLEEDFGIDLPDEEAEKWKILGDILDSVMARIRF